MHLNIPRKLQCPDCHVTLYGGKFHCTKRDKSLGLYGGEVPMFVAESPWYNDSQKEIWERYSYARRYNDLTVQYYDWWVSRILSKISLNTSSPLVELMCGAAEVCRRLPASFSSAYAMDINPRATYEVVQDMKLLHETHVTVACAPAEHVPLPDACAGAVVIQGALHHARPVMPDILSEVNRILVPGGVFVGSEPSNDNLFVRAVRRWQYRHSSMQGNDTEEDGFTANEMHQYLAAADLCMISYEQFGFVAYPLMGNTDILPLLANSKSLLLGRILLKLDELLEYVPIVRGMGWASLFVAVKE